MVVFSDGSPSVRTGVAMITKRQQDWGRRRVEANVKTFHLVTITLRLLLGSRPVLLFFFYVFLLYYRAASLTGHTMSSYSRKAHYEDGGAGSEFGSAPAPALLLYSSNGDE